MSTVQAVNAMVEALPEIDQEKVLAYVKELFQQIEENPFELKSKQEFYASIDRGIAQAEAGLIQNMDDAINEISRELAI